MLILGSVRLLRWKSVCKYSDFQRFQKLWSRRWTNCQLVRRDLAVQSFKSLGSLLKLQKGRELSTDSIWITNVLSSSNVRIWLPTTRAIWVLTDLILLSQIPPKGGAEGGLNLKLMCVTVSCLFHEHVRLFLCTNEVCATITINYRASTTTCNETTLWKGPTQFRGGFPL